MADAPTDTPAPAPTTIVQRAAQVATTAVQHTGVAGGGILAIKAFLLWFFIGIEQGRAHDAWFFITVPDESLLENMAAGLMLVIVTLRSMRKPKLRRATDTPATA